MQFLQEELKLETASQDLTLLSDSQKEALLTLHEYGLTAAMLLQFNKPKDVYEQSAIQALIMKSKKPIKVPPIFNWLHKEALHILVIERKQPLASALASIEGLSLVQVSEIKEGLEPSEIVLLKSHWHFETLKKLKKHGLSAGMLVKLTSKGEHAFCEALQSLVLNHNLCVDTALEVLNGLTAEQARGMKDGLERDEVVLLRNEWQIAALKKLKSYGLSVFMLLKMNDQVFDNCHYTALQTLILDKKLSPEAAVKIISQLSSIQAFGISQGLERDEVILLNNCWQMAALKDLKSHGLTARMLVEFNGSISVFDNSHYAALKKFVITKNYPILKAIEILSGLNFAQVDAICMGINRAEVLCLKNVWHVKAFSQWKNKGLTIPMLLQLDEKGLRFTSDHFVKLRYLVSQQIDIATALERLYAPPATSVEKKEESKCSKISESAAAANPAGFFKQPISTPNVQPIPPIQKIKTIN